MDIKTIKHQVDLRYEINQKNCHVLSDSNYLKQNMYVSFEMLYWLIGKVEQYEKALKEIAEETGTPYADIAIEALEESK